MFAIPDESTLRDLSRVEIRFAEAVYFFQQFRQHCGSPDSPRDSSFHWISYSDAFMMSLLSIQDLVGAKKRDELLRGYVAMKRAGLPIPPNYQPNPLLVLKLMRNRTVHHCVFAAPSSAKGKSNVSRVINVRVGGNDAGSWVEPRIQFATMRSIVRRVRDKWKRDKAKKKNSPNPKGDLQETRLYVNWLAELGKEDIRLDALFVEAIQLTAKTCGLSAPAL